MKRILTCALCLSVCLLLLVSCAENALPATSSPESSAPPAKTESSHVPDGTPRPMPPEQEQEGSPDIPPLLAGAAAFAPTEYDASQYLHEHSDEDFHLPMMVMKSREDIDAFLAACPKTAAKTTLEDYDEAWFAEKHLAVMYVSDSGSPQYLLEGETWADKDGELISTILIRYHQPMMVTENFIEFLMLIPLDATASRLSRVTNRILNGSEMGSRVDGEYQKHYHNEPVYPVLKENPAPVTEDTAHISLLRTQSLAELRPATATGDKAKEILTFFQSLAYDPAEVCPCVIDSNWMEMGTIYSVNDTYYFYMGGGWFVRCAEGQAYLTRDQAAYLHTLLFGVLDDGAVDYSLAHQTVELMEKGDTAFASYTPAEIRGRQFGIPGRIQQTVPVLTANSKEEVASLLADGKVTEFTDYLPGLTDADFADKTLLIVQFDTPNCHRDYLLTEITLRDGKLQLRFECTDSCEEEAIGSWGALIWMHKPFADTLAEIEATVLEYTVTSMAFKGEAFQTNHVSRHDEEFAPFFEKALNADSIGYGKGKSSALFGFSSVEDLQMFEALAGDLLAEIPLEQYDEAYFDDYTLFAVYLEVDSSGSVCEAKSIQLEGYTLVFYTEKTVQGVTDDMAGWVVLFTMPKGWLDDRLTYDAYWY